MKKNKGLIQFIFNILLTLLIYIVLFLFNIPKGIDILYSVLLQILGIVIMIFFFVFFHEFGHFVFGSISGYRLLCFRTGPFELMRNKDGKMKLNVNFQSGFILGQCLMIPPKPIKKKMPKFFLYNAGGLIFSYLLDAILLVLFFVIPNLYIKWMLLSMITLGAFLTINNSMYNENGLNDVCNHVKVKKNPKYIYSILYQLEMVSNVASGKRYGAKTMYDGYYEEKLNHITLPVAQFKFYQMVDKSNLDEAKKLGKLLKQNYNNIPLWLQRVVIIFDIMWSDIVLEDNMNSFKRDFRKIDEKTKAFCNKKNSELSYYYRIYESIYNNQNTIKPIIEEFLAQDGFAIGEKQSLEKKLMMLENKLNFYYSNNKSFVVRSVENEIN